MKIEKILERSGEIPPFVNVDNLEMILIKICMQ